MKDLAYYDGKISTIDEMSIPFCDRVHFFGDGVYEVAMARNYRIYALDEHIERFYRSAELVDINVPCEKQELSLLLYELVRELDSPDQNIYWQVTRGVAEREHTYSYEICGKLWVMLRPSAIKDIFTPVKAITLPDARGFNCDIKSLNLLPAVTYAQKARRSGAYEAILYREGGRVTECSHSNVHIITEDGRFKTAPTDNLILGGIARAHLISACKYLGITVDESPFYLDEMINAREVIISSTSGMCMICNEIDDKTVGGRAKDVVDALRHCVLKDFITKTS